MSQVNEQLVGHPDPGQLLRFHQLFKQGHTAKNLQEQWRLQAENLAEEKLQELEKTQARIEVLVRGWIEEFGALSQNEDQARQVTDLEQKIRGLEELQVHLKGSVAGMFEKLSEQTQLRAAANEALKIYAEKLDKTPVHSAHERELIQGGRRMCFNLGKGLSK